LPGDATQSVCLPPRRRLLGYLESLRPDVIVAATPGPFGTTAIAAARRLGISVIGGYHTDLDQLASLYWTRPWSRLFGQVSQRVLERRSRSVFAASRIVVANSTPMALGARRFGADRVAVMGTPLGGRFLANPAATAGGRLESVLFAGRLAPEKNVESVIAAARRHSHIRFRLAGDGPLAGKVRAACAELPNLEWLGWQPRSALPGLMDQADVVALPSHVEGFGTVALEAMVRGRLALVSSHCGIRDWDSLCHGLFAMGADESLDHAVARLEQMPPELRLALARRGRRAAWVFCDAIISEWVALVAEIASG
jgi:glycosyltransferase involved in cell wall biosynthesis